MSSSFQSEPAIYPALLSYDSTSWWRLYFPVEYVNSFLFCWILSKLRISLSYQHPSSVKKWSTHSHISTLGHHIVLNSGKTIYGTRTHDQTDSFNVCLGKRRVYSRLNSYFSCWQEDQSPPNKLCSILSDRHWGKPSQSMKGPICVSYTVFHDPVGRSSERIHSDDRPTGSWNPCKTHKLVLSLTVLFLLCSEWKQTTMRFQQRTVWP